MLVTKFKENIPNKICDMVIILYLPQRFTFCFKCQRLFIYDLCENGK